MSDKIMERVARRQAVLLDTAQMKSQFPDWLLRELEEAATDLQDAMAYAAQWRLQAQYETDVAQAAAEHIAELKAEINALRPRIRYFASGPSRHFWTDDLDLARRLCELIDPRDVEGSHDWTITDTAESADVAMAAREGKK